MIESSCVIINNRETGQYSNGIFFVEKKTVANEHFIKHLKPHMNICVSGGYVKTIKFIDWFGVFNHGLASYCRSRSGPQMMYGTFNKLLGEKLFELFDQDIEWSKERKLALGIREEDRFVCLHVRNVNEFPEEEANQV